MTESTERNLRNIGLLALRLGIGGMFVFWHGWDKISHGTAKWEEVSGAMAFLGVTFYPVFWGLVASLTEFVGGLCIMLGLFFRPACAFLAFTMIVAVNLHYHVPRMRPMISYPIEIGIVVLSLLIIGPGDWALGKLLWGRKKTPRA